MKLPEVGKYYNNFDDGRIRGNRKIPVFITAIIPAKEIDDNTFNQWLSEVLDYYWLYAEKTDYFIKGILEINENTKEEVVYVRTKNNEWFSLGFWRGLLDVNNKF